MIMQSGIKLSLFIGPIPVPAPQEAVEALTAVKVEAGSGETQSGFELTFELPARQTLLTLLMVAGGGTAPWMRVVLVVQIGGRAEPLIDGMITNVEAQPGEGGVSRLVVKGKDLTALMDVNEVRGVPYPAMPPFVRVQLILAKYMALGVIPVVMPEIVADLPIPTERIEQQCGTDYGYVSTLARQCGYVFFLEPGAEPATSIAYWGPEIRVGMPQPALSVNMDAMSNVEQLSFSFDKERKTVPIVFIQNPFTKAPTGIPIPDVTPLNPPLGLVPPLPIKTVNLDDTGRMSFLSALMTGIAYAGQNSDCVFGRGTLDVVRYGRLLKSRRLVGVRGAGRPFDGLYYVTSVSHDIKRGEYKESFELARNALVSTLPMVPV
jgi:hypothetical protein